MKGQKFAFGALRWNLEYHMLLAAVRARSDIAPLEIRMVHT